MKAKKENKIYRIETEAEKARYLKDGYDIYDDEGNILEHSPKKKILYSEYEKLRKENESLKKELEEIRSKVENAEKSQKAAKSKEGQ